MEQELIRDIDVQSVMTRSSLPVGGYSVNPYVGCPHACKYCYASFMKRFTGHTEPWGSFLDVKHWKPVGDPHRFDGQRIVIGSVTDGYNPFEEHFQRTRHLLEELRGTTAEILICTKSDLVLRDLDLLREFPRVTVSWSVNTLDEAFRADMDRAVSVARESQPARAVQGDHHGLHPGEASRTGTFIRSNLQPPSDGLLAGARAGYGRLCRRKRPAVSRERPAVRPLRKGAPGCG